MVNLRKFQISDDTFWGYSQIIDLDEVDSILPEVEIPYTQFKVPNWIFDRGFNKSTLKKWKCGVTGNNGLVIPVSFLLLGFMHILQKNHAITVTFSLVTLIAIIFPFYPKLFIVLLWLGNCSILIYKHKDEYSEGIVLRQWVYIIRSRLT